MIRKDTMDTLSRRIIFMTIGLLGMIGCAGERPQNLGAKDGMLTSCPSSPNCISSQAADEGHQIAPLVFTGGAENALARLKQVLGRRSDTTIIAEQSGYLRVEFRTTLFVDDGEFLLDQARGIIHVRSASRLGYSDLGKNRSRMEEIRRLFADTGVAQ
jgi:uncharacterized protein (DUF1499 family)